MIDFPNTFEGASADRDLISKLTTPNELSGFFNKCMSALIDVTDVQAFTNETTLSDSVDAYLHLSSPIEQFIDKMCDLDDPDEYVLIDTLFRAYTKWSKEKHIRAEKKKDLTIALTQHGCVVRQVTTDNEERKRAYIGVDFKHRISDFA